MRVLLASTNRSRLMMPPYPLGLACVAASVDPARHTLRVWDAMFEENWEASLRACLRDFRPEVVGLSIRNVDDQDIRSPCFLLEEARAMAAVCREESDAPLVLGGSGYSLFPGEMLAYLDADYGVVGEGERAFPQLLECLETGNGRPAGIPGVVWREEGRLGGAPPRWDMPLDSLPSADRDRPSAAAYYDAVGTIGIPNVATVQSKRGCPLSCTYCSTFAIEGAAIRTRSPQAVAAEVGALRDRGFDRLQFVDSVFTNPPWHARALCEELLHQDLETRWSCTVSPAFADPDLLRLMRRAGCVLAMVGNEHGCSRMLQTLGKGFAREEVERCFAACRDAGLRLGAFLLLGGPGEDRQSVQEAVDLMQRLRPDQVSVSVGIRLYPGCELTRVAQEQDAVLHRGVSPPDATSDAGSLLTPSFYLAPGLEDWIWDMLDPIVSQTPGWTY